MKQIYEKSKELHVRALVVYGKAADHTLWADAEYSVVLKAEEVLDAYVKGMLVILDGEVYKKPISVDEDGVCVTVETVSNAVAMVEWELGSTLDSAA